ncbi:beta-ketoacyl synthase N-terminal-like domain-containing protein [Andreprevotia chitinilytica]|uniref:beta-ketoacyl synthase N-terminal-like domain-containing protein n=1 Tax=Andreprevotia chitinilytica TaxID=396808 RepID=UPI000691DA1E|nr:beta-ketoacyl synthase N-terminal-like domain-containing protein [Andreprevotia chitinilytica]
MNPRYEGRIAIIGMAGRMPNTTSLNDFWRALVNGESLIRPLDEAELIEQGIAPEWLANKHYIRAASNMADIDCFDHDFFGYGAREASIIDPQQRILLELAHEVFEDACYVPETLQAKVGVYLGAGYCNYLVSNLSGEIDEHDQLAGLQILMGNDKEYAATRVSYKLNLTGPSLAINSACSTSLVALHQACRALQSYECDMALAGAAKINIPNDVGYLHQEGGISSKDGLCRPYDAEGSGPVFGSGAGVVLLKRIEDAIADNDKIYAVIRGSAVNNDGAAKVSFSAPSTDGQIAVIAEALADAGITAPEVGYVEGHGTSTPLGDPIEVTALSELYLAEGAKPGSRYLGSVKANIGHLEAAAGMAGLFKSVFAIRDNLIPPLLNFQRQNKNIRFEQTPFTINTTAASWPAELAENRIAAVSSFGIGGTNAHVILESYQPDEAEPQPLAGPYLIPLSAKTETALARLKDIYAGYLAGDAAALDQVAYSAAVGRQHYPHRLALLANDKAGLLAQLNSREAALSAPDALVLQEAELDRRLVEEEGSTVGLGVQRHLQAIDALVAKLAAPGWQPNAAEARRFNSAVVQLAYAQWLAQAGLPLGHIHTDAANLAAACLATGVINLEQAVRAVLVCHQRLPKESLVRQSLDLGRAAIYRLGSSTDGRYHTVQAPDCWLAADTPAADAAIVGAIQIGQDIAALNEALLRALGQAYVGGATLNWTAIYQGGDIQKTSLPTYPFEKVRCWIDATPAAKRQPANTVPRANAITAQDVIGIIADFAKIDAAAISEETQFQRDLVMESMMLAELNASLTKQFGLQERIPLPLYFDSGKVGDLVAWLTAYQARNQLESTVLADVTDEADPLAFIREWAESSAFPDLQRLDRKLVHKSLLKNVLVARTAPISADLFAAEITQDVTHDYHYEHAQDHVPGLYLIEAARQAATAIVHQYFQVPLGFKFIMNDLSSSFEHFAELDAPVFLTMQFVDVSFKNDVLERATAKTAFIQRGKSIGRMQSQAVIFSAESYDVVRDGVAIIAG